ncbi:hypothetical protein EG68_02180 [Paragonimus skrjabini miyazakii]|uniref:Uncharacterized protein n=1 Tax=Paragonimus skrjabini miyazakii TaxID=59628 RepID=A0A8S9Z9V0_9TREM|nr:hypothetical protein EG68_02180 [Paragonimus skrjabini miyazakii]
MNPFRGQNELPYKDLNDLVFTLPALVLSETSSQSLWAEELAKRATGSLLQCAGGVHESVTSLTQALLYGFQAFAASCRMRTQLVLTTLAYRSTRTTEAQSVQTLSYQTRGAEHKLEALIRQLMWLLPRTSSYEQSMIVAYGFCSSLHPNSWLEMLAWSVGLKAVLLQNGRFLSCGGLSAGVDDHCVDSSPWITRILSSLSSNSAAWRSTEINPMVVFQPSTSLSSCIQSNVPGSIPHINRAWQLLVFEHSTDCRFLYMSLPFTGKPKDSDDVSRRVSVTKGSKSEQYIHFRINTSQDELLRTVCGWRNRQNQLDEYFRKRSVVCKDCKPNITCEALWHSPFLEALMNTLSESSLLSASAISGQTSECELPTSRRDSDTTGQAFMQNEESGGVRSWLNVVQDLCASTTLPSNGFFLLADAWLAELPLESLIVQAALSKLVKRRHINSWRERSSNASGSLESTSKRRISRRKPVESLPFGWITRDWSFQLLYFRIAGHETGGRSSSDETGQESSNRTTSRKTEAHVPHLPSRHPLLRETVDKSGLPVKSHQHATGCFSINSSAVRLLIDPYGDTTGITDDAAIDHTSQDHTHSNGPRSLRPFGAHMQNLMVEPASRLQQMTNRWSVFLGQEPAGYIPSAEEIYVILNENPSGLLTYTTETLFKLLPPPSFASLSLTNCQFMGIFDNVHSPNSMLRLGATDTLKSVIEREMERPLSAAALVSLTGCRTIIISNAITNMFELQALVEQFLRRSLDEGNPIGQSVLLAQLSQLSTQLSRYLDDSIAITSKPSPTDSDCLKKEHEDTSLGIENFMTIDSFSLVIYGIPNVIF